MAVLAINVFPGGLPGKDLIDVFEGKLKLLCRRHNFNVAYLDSFVNSFCKKVYPLATH